MAGSDTPMATAGKKETNSENDEIKEVIEESVNTDGRKPYNWESGYPESARKEIRYEAIYIGIILILSLLGLLFNWCGYFSRFICLEAEKQSSFETILYYFISGLLGGTIFGIKYFYRVVARGYWSQDRRYWRIFSPWISSCIATVVGCMVISGFINANRLRVHFEWIYDGDYIFLVQADEETESTGVNPLEISIETSEKTAADTIPFPRCLHRLTAEDADKYKSYSKIQNPLLYQKLGQDIAPLYILDDKSVLEQLAQGVLNQNLESDLQILVSQSLIIRTDIDTDDKEERQLLPRTCEIREMSLAVEWLEENYKKLSKNSKSNIIFILHNFIPAFSSAFAYASPQDNIVRIEALWGLPEGLYYYSHDKYIVDTIKTDISAINIEEFQIKEKRSFKKYFVFPMKDGSWDVQSLIKPYDWKSSIPQKDWVREIALVTRKIAEAECQSVNVMWFVGVDDSRYSRNVFPWFHEPYKYIEDKGTPRNKLSFERTIVIHKLKDIELLESQSISQRDIIRNILVQPTDEKILRDREVIGRIGKTAKSLGANIILEGGVLSHAYYQLIRTGAKVEARNTFSKTQSLEFNKLVRDKIPEKIERNGEEVVTTQLNKDVFISLLKRKLVEESLEVYDATEKEDMVAELADVMEVIDAIIKEERINRQNILDKKEKKREKVGGFEKGVYLKRTLSSTEMSDGKVITDHTAVDVRQKIAKSTDARKYSTANEAFTRIKVPITLDAWEIRPPSPTSNIDIVVRGRRKQNILQIEISIFEKAEQMSLFD